MVHKNGVSLEPCAANLYFWRADQCPEQSMQMIGPMRTASRIAFIRANFAMKNRTEPRYARSIIASAPMTAANSIHLDRKSRE